MAYVHLGRTVVSVRFGDAAGPYPEAQATLAHFIVSAEGFARGGESDEFLLLFAEVFPTGHHYEPVLLPASLSALGIGRTDQREDDGWAEALSCYYDPAAH